MQANCFLLTVRAYQESTSTTKLSCTINLKPNHNIEEEINVIYKKDTINQIDTLDNSVNFVFNNDDFN